MPESYTHTRTRRATSREHSTAEAVTWPSPTTHSAAATDASPYQRSRNSWEAERNLPQSRRGAMTNR